MLSPHHKATSTQAQEADYWHPNLDIVLVDFNDPLDIGNIHPFLRPMISLDHYVPNLYQPIIFSNNFWKLAEQYIPVSKLAQDNTVTSLNISVTHSSFFKFKWQQILDRAIKQQPQADFEVFKRAFVDNSPLLLAATAIATLLHTIFDFLSFKNGKHLIPLLTLDIQFWKQRKDFKGLSLRSILIDCVFQVVILLYLLENETSRIVIASAVVGLLIEVWKVGRVFRIDWHNFKLLVTHGSEYEQSGTKEYDERAIRVLTWLAVPLLLGYSAYSFVYEQHKSWYSWILASLVGFVYSFGKGTRVITCRVHHDDTATVY